MMKNYSELSDFEINLQVFLGAKDYDEVIMKPVLSESSVRYGNGCEWLKFDPCNNPSDAWPIIVDNEISLISRCANGEWKAQLHLGRDDIFDSYASCWDIKPLRAAMIVYLMMKDNENA